MLCQLKVSKPKEKFNSGLIKLMRKWERLLREYNPKHHKNGKKGRPKRINKMSSLLISDKRKIYKMSLKRLICTGTGQCVHIC